MIDALREEEIVKKVGGRFKLSALIQKRLVALNQGARQLVDSKSEDKMEVVVEEILQNKIFLDSNNTLRTVADEPHDGGGPPELDLTNL